MRPTHQAQNLIKVATAEAERSRHASIGAGHLLLGLASLYADDYAIAPKVLIRAGVDEDRIRAVAKEKLAVARPVQGTRGPILGPLARFILVRSIQFAQDSSSEDVGSHHILLALIVETDRFSEGLVSKLGASYAVIKNLIETEELTENEADGWQWPVIHHTYAGTYLSEIARQLAEQSGEERTGTHHFLAALFYDPESAAAKVLALLGVTLRRIVETLPAVDVTETSDSSEYGPPPARIFEYGPPVAVPVAGDPFDFMGRLTEVVPRDSGLAFTTDGGTVWIHSAPGVDLQSYVRMIEENEHERK
jgi:ATP-dependent Clp protease ATP-binding subunit ClpA